MLNGLGGAQTSTRAGPSSLIYTSEDVLEVMVIPSAPYGYRYVDERVRLVTCSSTYFDPIRNVTEYTRFNDDITIGQGNKPGMGVVVWIDGVLRRLIGRGTLWSVVHVRRHGDLFAISASCFSAHETWFWWMTRAELTALSQDPKGEIQAFNHPTLIVPFRDPAGESGAPAEVVVNRTIQQTLRPCVVAEDSLEGYKGPILGVYSETLNPQNALKTANGLRTRVFLCHDSPAPWTLPAGLRQWDVPLIELYRSAGEPLSAAVARWKSAAIKLLDDWPGDCGVIPQFYCMGGAPPNELWPVDEVLAGLDHLHEIVNISSRIKVVAPFAWQRANGIVAHPELRVAFASLLRATPGIPALLPVPGPPPPPLTTEGDLMLLSTFDPTKKPVAVKAVKPLSGHKDVFTLILADGRVYSMQPDGTDGDRDPGAEGSYERCRVSGNVATFYPAGETYHTRTFVVVEGL